MDSAVDIIFALALALLFVHEMDAIRGQEWEMFIVQKDMNDEKAYRVFMLLHIPLYAAVLFLLLSPLRNIAYYIIDGFLAAHLLLHLGFGRHPENRLNGVLSKWIIGLAGSLGILHLVLSAVSQIII